MVLIIQDVSRSHLQVYQAVSQLRASHKLTSTGLFSTEQVFSLSRSSDSDSFIVAMNVMEEEVTVSLEDLVMEMDRDCDSGEVLVRSAGEGLKMTRDIWNVASCIGLIWKILKKNRVFIINYSVT